MSDLRDLKALQLDALKEVANIGAGHAATALSQMTGSKIMISVPRITVTPLEAVPAQMRNPQGIVAGVLMQMVGDLTGRTLMMIPETDARALCDRLLRRPPGTTTRFDELEQSSLKETGNILGSAYLNALSEFMGMMLLPSVPSLAIDVASAVLTSVYLSFGHDRDVAFCVETNFRFEGSGRELYGQFLLLPDAASLKAIFDAIRLV